MNVTPLLLQSTQSAGILMNLTSKFLLMITIISLAAYAMSFQIFFAFFVSATQSFLPLVLYLNSISSVHHKLDDLHTFV
jgi:hypothetical protein